MITDVLTVRTEGPGRGQTVQSTHYTGPALLDPSFAKTRTRGFWFMHREGVLPPSAESAAQHPKIRERPVDLYFHGGAGVTFSAADLFMGQCLASNLAKSSGVDVFNVDYLLAPHGPFPVPLMQGLAGYLYLKDTLGYSADQIFIGGDSFGGWLTLVLERYLRTYSDLIFDDPASLTAHGEGASSRFVSRDIIDMSYGDWGADAQGLTAAHRHKNPMTLDNPWYTHSNRRRDELASLPPIYVANGDKEVLRDEGRYFAKLVRDAKALHEREREVTLESEPDMPHDYFTLDTERKRTKQVYKRMGTWMAEQSGAQKGACKL